jgi:rhamnopyranosyl-N-acetylglucosaminyl-diphospho-decaprenol beta-1,3/1,4-galactofuranosyltransferase
MSDTVMAVVLTYDAPDALERCLAAIASQTRRPDAVLVVDNASVPRVLVADGSASVLRLDTNLGPAGGYAAGLDEFLRTDHCWAWVLDDDVAPDPGALGAQLAAAGRTDGPCLVMATMVDDATGSVDNTQGWCAVLVARDIVSSVGLPDASLFWWNEDTEYLQWRIPRAGYPVVRAEDARVQVTRGRPTSAKPAWKYYYEARNQVHYRLHTQRPSSGEMVPRHLRSRVRRWRAARAVTKLAVRSVVREREGRAAKLWMVARGAIDGVRGRLGRTVAPDAADRPRQPTEGALGG